MSPPDTHSRRRSIFMMDLWATVPYYTAYLCRALIASGAQVTVGSISYYLDPLCFSGRGLQPQPGCLDLVGRLQLPATPRRLLKFAEALLNMAALALRFLFAPPAVVHVQYLPLLQWRLPLEHWFLALCRFRGAAIVLTVHDILPHNTGDRHHAIFRDLYSRVDVIICHSDHVKIRLQAEFGVPDARISVIAHGPFFYDLPAESAPPQLPPTLAPRPAPLTVLWQGIISPYKGVDVLLEAWRAVEASGIPVHLLVAGTGSPDLLRTLSEQAHTLGLSHIHLDFRFVSAAELVAAYRTADVVVYPYRAITTSGALATGLALGKTIVATDLPVFGELLADHENALLVPPGDPVALAAALVELARDPGLRARLAARVIDMDFGDQSWVAIAAKTLEVYASAAGHSLTHAPLPDPALPRLPSEPTPSS